MHKHNKNIENKCNPNLSFGMRAGALALSGLALLSTITFMGEGSMHGFQGATHTGSLRDAGIHEIARLKDDAPSAENIFESQVFPVQLGEAVLEFAADEDLERLARV